MLIECSRCEAMVDAEELASYTRDLNTEEQEDQFEDRWTFYFLMCPRCRWPLLAGRWHHAEDGRLMEAERFYPAREEIGRFTFPTPIVNSYNEALACYKAKAYTATAILCRKTLEGIYQQHGIKARSLVSALEMMRDRESLIGVSSIGQMLLGSWEMKPRMTCTSRYRNMTRGT